MANTVATENGSGKMVRIPCLTTMRSQQERVETTSLPKGIERRHIGEQIVYPISVRWILLVVPYLGNGVLAEEAPFDLALIINAVKSYDTLQEDMQFWVTGGIMGDLEKRPENVDHNRLEIFHYLAGLVYIIKSWNLNKPSDIV